MLVKAVIGSWIVIIAGVIYLHAMTDSLPPELPQIWIQKYAK